MKKTLFIFAIAALLTGCGERQHAATNDTTISTHKNLPGDSARYGLAADGSTDSLLVFLPCTGERLDTFDILQARHDHQVSGWLRTGDNLTVLVDSMTDSTMVVQKVARRVINISQLQGLWCYEVTPQWRREVPEGLPDSIRQRLMAPREYGLDLNADGSVRPMGGRQHHDADRMSPVKYPPLPRYRSWHMYNGHLVLCYDSTSAIKADTADIRQLRRDTLVLLFGDRQQQYYRKK